MNKQIKKTVSVILAVVMLLSVVGVMNVAAQTDNTVRVIVRNTNYKTADGAPWEGVLIDENIALETDDSVETVLERTITDCGYQLTVSAYGYISSVNNLAEYDNNGSGGWMATLNDWFTADSVSAYTVANGELQPGDEIVMMYTNSWGYDCGSYYGDFTTTLTSSQVIKGAFVSKDTVNAFNNFDPAVTQGEIIITAEQAQIALYPEVYNKNYQVRTYLNDYQPEVNGAEIRRGRSFTVKDGDVVYVGVGNPAWASMNSWAGTAEETVYAFTVSYVPVKGDLDGDGIFGINDATEVQRYLADFRTLTDSEFSVADFNEDGDVTVDDVTKMQRVLAEYEE